MIHVDSPTSNTALAGLSDCALIRRFAERGDEAAFALLVSRHGPLVLGVCGRVLRNEADAMDAFQATFLVLAQKARIVRWRASLANWLFGVAYRCARKAAGRIVRHRERQLDAADLIPDRAFAELTSREAEQALIEELDRLPARYREPLVLCYLEGLSREEAGRQLGCTTAAVKGRLGRGRQRLKRQLALRGVVFSFALAAVHASLEKAKAAMTGSLIASTTKVGVSTMAGPACGELLSPRVVDLAKGGVEPMTRTIWLGGLLAASLASVAVVWSVAASTGSPPAAQAVLDSQAPPEPKPADAESAPVTLQPEGPPEPATIEAAQQALVTAAEEAIEAAEEALDVGIAERTMDRVCDASRRLMDAELTTCRDPEQKLRAIRAQLKRVERHHATVSENIHVGRGSPHAYATTKFYVAEARLLLLRQQAAMADTDQRPATE